MAAWYSDGLPFECARCSACCRLAPGFVFLSAHDLRRLLEGTRLDFRAFLAEYCRIVDMGTHASLSLRETKSYDCSLWKGDGCSVYAHRPGQCRTYPFWDSIVDSPRAWREEAASCPGIGSGARVPQATIEERLAARSANPPLVLERGTRLEDLDEAALLGR